MNVDWFRQQAKKRLQELPEIKPSTKRMSDWIIATQTLIVFKAAHEYCEQKEIE